MSPSSYHCDSFMATHLLGTHNVPFNIVATTLPVVTQICKFHKTFIIVAQKAHCFHDFCNKLKYQCKCLLRLVQIYSSNVEVMKQVFVNVLCFISGYFCYQFIIYIFHIFFIFNFSTPLDILSPSFFFFFLFFFSFFFFFNIKWVEVFWLDSSANLIGKLIHSGMSHNPYITSKFPGGKNYGPKKCISIIRLDQLDQNFLILLLLRTKIKL